MTNSPRDWRWNVVWAGLACAIGLGTSGCGEPITNSGIAHPGDLSSVSSVAPVTNPAPGDSSDIPDSSGATAAADAAGSAPGAATDSPAAQVDSTKPRTFEAEGPDGALRVTFDDLDLMKHLKMDPVTPDCVEKMPDWLRGLNGKKLRVRGFMKPSTQSEGIPEFLFVRSTDLCCFGPKGKVYHMIDTTLKQGKTTDYIELKAFDVVGTFRIELVQLDDGFIFLLYHIDDATIIR